MGLDMYARKYKKEDAISPVLLKEDVRGQEFFYWRKHHDLHGWMEKLYREKGGTKEFNCEAVLLEEDDLEKLKTDILFGNLPATTGFFFGNNKPNDESKRKDLEFIQKAKEAIADGFVVYYSSWW